MGKDYAGASIANFLTGAGAGPDLKMLLVEIIGKGCRHSTSWYRIVCNLLLNKAWIDTKLRVLNLEVSNVFHLKSLLLFSLKVQIGK